MKKLLALVLALVMVMGLATVGANAALKDFPDASSVNNEEAMAVMNAVGVFSGKDGKLAPQDNLTRAEAAKLIAYLDLGEKTAEALAAVEVFPDVPANHWAAKYVAYCKDAGIIQGSDGKYLPDEPLTGYAFGAYVLAVLGYDRNVEGMTGGSWQIATAKLMSNNNITKGTSKAGSETLTREEAAQYCLNALKATMVDYATKGTTVSVNGIDINTGASKADDVYSAASYNKAIKTGTADNDGKFTLQLGEKLYEGDLKLTTPGDDFGAPANKWTYKNATVGTYNDTPAATYNNKVTLATIYNLLGKDVVDDLDEELAAMTLTVDGTPDEDFEGANYVIKNSSGAAFGTAEGAITEVYIDDDGHVIAEGANAGEYAEITVVVKWKYLMQANADYNSKTEKLGVTTLTAPEGVNITSLSAEDFAVADYKEDDYILFTYADGDVQTIEKADIVSGAVSTWTANKNVTLDGTKYVYGAKAYAEGTAHSKAATFTIGDTAKIVVDGLGNALYVDETKASNDDILFVTEVKNNGFTVQAKVVNVNGTKGLIYIDTADSKDAEGNKIFDGKTDEELEGLAGKFYAYEVDGAQYELTPYAKQTVVKTTAAYAEYNAENAFALNKVTSLTGADDAVYTANSKTVYIVGDENDDVTVYTGVKNAPDIIAGSTPVFLAYNNTTDKELTYVFVQSKEENGIDDASDTSELIYVMSKGSDVITGSDKTKYIEVKALVDGEETTLKVKDANKASIDAKALYKNLKTNADGYVTGATSVNVDSDDYDAIAVEGYNAFGYSDGVFTASDYSKFIKTDKVYVVVAKNGGDLLDNPAATYELTETTFSGLKNFVKGYTITAEGYTTLNSDGEVTAAYITITASTEGEAE